MSDGTGAVPRDPIFAVVYGVPKMGKTVDCVYALPNALYIGLPAAVQKPAHGVVGLDIPTSHFVQVRRISDATAVIRKLPPGANGAVVDDFSHLAEQTWAALEKSFTGYRLFGELRDEIGEFRDTARASKTHTIVNCHESAATTKNGNYIRGGPRLPGRMPEDLPSMVCMVLRATVNTGRPGPWPGVYRCSPLDTGYITGDRHHIAYDECPMNLAELMRAAGYVLPRAPGMEWAEAVVEKLAGRLLAIPQASESNTFATPAVVGTRADLDAATKAELGAAATYMRAHDAKTSQQAAWVLRDAIDRCLIRRARQNPLAAFGL